MLLGRSGCAILATLSHTPRRTPLVRSRTASPRPLPSCRHPPFPSGGSPHRPPASIRNSRVCLAAFSRTGMRVGLRARNREFAPPPPSIPQSGDCGRRPCRVPRAPSPTSRPVAGPSESSLARLLGAAGDPASGFDASDDVPPGASLRSHLASRSLRLLPRPLGRRPETSRFSPWILTGRLVGSLAPSGSDRSAKGADRTVARPSPLPSRPCPSRSTHPRGWATEPERSGNAAPSERCSDRTVEVRSPHPS
jgi:hypothetical protein